MENISKKPSIGKKLLGGVKKIFSHKWVRVVSIIVLLLLIMNVVLTNFVKKNFNKSQEAAVITATAEKRDIEKVLSSSGTIAPLHTYDVTSLVDGEVISADFEEGDQIKEGDILYKVTTESMDTKIDSAQTNVERAENKYEKALTNKVKAEENYREALEDLGDLAMKSKVTGIITELLVKEGDNIQKGSQIAKIYDNREMLLSVPFSSSQVSKSWVNKSADVEIDDSGELLKGTITKVGTVENVLSGNRVVKTVTIKVKNPGGITTETTASATIGDVASSDVGNFGVIKDTILTSDTSGEISKLKIAEGDAIKEGEVILVLDSESMSDQLDSFQSAIDNANNSVDDAKDAIVDAKNSLEEQIDTLADYNITAPISGRIVTKSTLVGDKIKASNMTTSLCKIYDLSAVIFKMSIDELDIMSVKLGQQVEITADALEGVEISGVVTNISLVSTTSGGVTQYPVTVKIEKLGNLLPGMNVTGKIITEKVEDVVTIPVDALMRGNVVYVKDDSVLEAVGEVPIGFREVKVEIGLSDGDYIEVSSGLEEGAEVYVVRATNTDQMMFGPPDGMGGPDQGGDADQGGYNDQSSNGDETVTVSPSR